MSSSKTYIVVFKQGTPEEEIESAVRDVESKGGIINQRYRDALLGFSASMPEVCTFSLEQNNHLDYIEHDGQVAAFK
ncbi:hypothetical protein BGX28_003615 [Mortierella sp. GBA30]|nr:hypothetical protein BGX28_003615 [Mortierella sp. GBA30]